MATRLTDSGQADFGLYNEWDVQANLTLTAVSSFAPVVALGSGSTDQIELASIRSISLETSPTVGGLVSVLAPQFLPGAGQWSDLRFEDDSELPLNAAVIVDIVTADEVPVTVKRQRRVIGLLQAHRFAASGDVVAASPTYTLQCSFGHFEERNHVNTFQPVSLPAGTYTVRFQRVIQGIGAGRLVPNLGGEGGLASSADLDLLVDAATTLTPPLYATLMTLPHRTIEPASRLRVNFSATTMSTGVGGINSAINFRFLLNGVLLSVAGGGGTTMNAVTNQIQAVSFGAARAVTAGIQTLVVEWAKFGPGTQTAIINAATLPDLFHASLHLREYRT